MAYVLNRADVDNFLSELPVNELRNWYDYQSIKEEKENYRLGLLLSAIYNQARRSKQDRFFRPEDFFSFNHLEKQEKETDWKTQKARLMAFASSTTYQNKKEG